MDVLLLEYQLILLKFTCGSGRPVLVANGLKTPRSTVYLSLHQMYTQTDQSGVGLSTAPPTLGS